MAKLKDEFVAGRLSHETFMHRVDLVMGTRRRADLPALIADLPAEPLQGGALVRWFRGAWSRFRGGAAQAPGAAATGQGRDTGPSALPVPRRPVKAATAGTSVSPERKQPFSLQFPRAAGDRFTIGRDASCDLAIADMTVSRLHAQLERTKDGWLLSDLESTNGTRVNGWRVRGQVPVGPGDLVSFGYLEVVFAEPSPGG